MTEAILPLGAYGMSSVFARHSMTRTRNSWYGAENDNNFRKVSAAYLAERSWMRQDDFRIHLYSNNSHNFFCIIYHRSRAYLKPSVNFGNTFSKSPLRIPAYRTFHLNSELNFEIFFNWLIMSSSNHRD